MARNLAAAWLGVRTQRLMGLQLNSRWARSHPQAHLGGGPIPKLSRTFAGRPHFLLASHSAGSLNVLKTCSWQREHTLEREHPWERKTEAAVFDSPTSKVTCQHFPLILVATQTNLGHCRRELYEGVDTRWRISLGATLVAGYRKCFWIRYVFQVADFHHSLLSLPEPPPPAPCPFQTLPFPACH